MPPLRSRETSRDILGDLGACFCSATLGDLPYNYRRHFFHVGDEVTEHINNDGFWEAENKGQVMPKMRAAKSRPKPPSKGVTCSYCGTERAYTDRFKGCVSCGAYLTVDYEEFVEDHGFKKPLDPDFIAPGFELVKK